MQTKTHLAPYSDPDMMPATYSAVQRFLDQHVLQHMEESRDHGWGRSEYAFHLGCFVNEWITRDMARAICRSLTDRGYAFYMRGLWSEDGMPGGAGYGITDKGADYLETIFSRDGRSPAHD